MIYPSPFLKKLVKCVMEEEETARAAMTKRSRQMADMRQHVRTIIGSAVVLDRRGADKESPAYQATQIASLGHTKCIAEDQEGYSNT